MYISTIPISGAPPQRLDSLELFIQDISDLQNRPGLLSRGSRADVVYIKAVYSAKRVLSKQAYPRPTLKMLYMYWCIAYLLSTLAAINVNTQ